MNTTENRSVVTEQRLADYGLTPALVRLSLDDLDHGASMKLQNRGRVTIDADHVLAMSLHLDVDADHILPPIVVARYRGKLAIVDGNHRTEAARLAGRTHLDAYLIEDADTATIEALALEANAAGSKALTPDERLQLALDYAQLTGDLPMAARRFGYQYDTLQKKRRVKQGQDKAERAARVRGALPDSKAEALNRLDEDQIRILGRDLIEQAPTSELQQAVANIKAVPSADRALQVQQEVGRLAQIVKAKKTPAAKARAKVAGPTVKQAIAQVQRITAQMKANPSWRTDAALVAALRACIEEVDKHGAQHAA